MARGRMISKSLSTSEKFAALVTTAGALAEFCQALYPLVVTHSDDFGRLQGDTFTVKHMCFPSSPRSADEFSTALAHLHAVGLLIRYEVDGKRYIQVTNFEQHQIGLHKRTRSTFPRVPGISGNDEESPGTSNSGNFREFPDQEKGTKGKGTKGKRREVPPVVPHGGRITRTERKHAEDIRSRVWGGCRHHPTCANYEACIAEIVATIRANQGAA